MNPTTVLAQIDTLTDGGGGLSSDIAPLLSWALWVWTVVGVVSVAIGVTQIAFAKSTGRSNDGTGRGVMAIVGGIVIAGSSSLVGVLVRPADDTSEPSTLAPPPDDTTAPTPPALSNTSTGTTPRAADAPVDWTPLIWIGGAAAGVLVLALAGYLLVRTRRHILDRRTAQRTRDADLAAAVGVYGQVADAYAAYLTDPYAIFERPLLDDTSDHLTATFIDAFATAGELRPDQSTVEDPDRIEHFRAAAQSALRAWNNADSHARRIGMGSLDADNLRTLRRARSALDLALDGSAPAGERHTALDTFGRLTAELVTIPDRIRTRVTTAIDTTPRKQLTTG